MNQFDYIFCHHPCVKKDRFTHACSFVTSVNESIRLFNLSLYPYNISLKLSYLLNHPDITYEQLYFYSESVRSLVNSCPHFLQM